MDAVQTLGMWLFWRSGGNGILVGSAGEVDQRMASGDPHGIEFRSIEMHPLNRTWTLSLWFQFIFIDFWLAAYGDT